MKKNMCSPLLAELPSAKRPAWARTVNSAGVSETMPDGRAWPRMSIVTPSYNQGQYLGEAIWSILSQGYPNLEYFVLDGGSRDGSVDVIKRYQSYLTYWRSGPDDGPYAAVNEGLSRATGDIFCWLNSDDVHFPGSLRFVASAFAGLPEMEWLTTVCPGSLNCHGDRGIGRLSGICRDSFLAGRHLPGTCARCIGFIQQESTFFRSALWRRVGGIKTEFDLAGDFALWSEFFLDAEVHITSALLGAFRWHGENRSKNLDRYVHQAKDILAAHRAKVSWRAHPVLEAVANSPIARFQGVARWVGYEAQRAVRADAGGVSRWQTEVHKFL